MNVKVKISNSSDWVCVGNGLWKHKTVYFSKKRNKRRVKWIDYQEVCCAICGEIHLQKKSDVGKYERSYCSDKCRAKAIKIHYSGENHMSYVNGRYVTYQGYVKVKVPEHHRANKNGYVYEHILVAEKMVGRKIGIDEDVHHVNENRSDNRPENLEVLSRSKHVLRHKKRQFNLGKEFLKTEVIEKRKTFAELARELGCSASLVGTECKKHGIKSPYDHNSRKVVMPNA